MHHVNEDNRHHIPYVSFMFCLFDYERLEDNPHEVMFGTGPEIAIFQNIAPYVSIV